MDISKKTCIKCSEIKKQSEFYASRNYCIVCKNKFDREKYRSKKVNSAVLVKSCEGCKLEKTVDMFVAGRNICKDCRNIYDRKQGKMISESDISDDKQYKCETCEKLVSIEMYHLIFKICNLCLESKIASNKLIKNDDESRKICVYCGLLKAKESFVKKATICDCCSSLNVRNYKLKLSIKREIVSNHNKKEQQNNIGENNKICNECKLVISKSSFRTGHSVCIACQRNYWSEYGKTNRTVIRIKVKVRKREDPVFRLICNQRSRIKQCLKRKQKKSIEYLGCNAKEFYDWIDFAKDINFTYENYGKEWQIDHVIPLANFDMNSIDQQSLAFNWRNTMPILTTINLSKQSKIIPEQVKQQWDNLLKYEEKTKNKIPIEIRELYARYLDTGSS